MREDSTRKWSAEIFTLTDQLVTYYIHPDVANKVRELLHAKLTAGAYQELTSNEAFARAITADMQSVNGDKHLYLAHTSKYLPEQADPVLTEGTQDPRAAGLLGDGFAKVERLPGNVALLDIRRFFDPAGSGFAAVAAMNLVASADVLLIDLRECSGGEPEMVVTVHSYLVDERTQLNGLVFPAEKRTIQYWTLPYVPGPKFGGTKPIYVLTSNRTFSGAEGFSYDLQQYGRAAIVGEPTAGGANFHFPMRVSDHLFSAVPSGYPVQPVSGTNWEGVGVQPDIPVAVGRAFKTAYGLALDYVMGLDADGPRRQVAEQAARARASLDAD